MSLQTKAEHQLGQQFLIKGFPNDPGQKANQDVGLDGVPDALEREIFAPILGSALEAVANDPAADNFRHFYDNGYTTQGAQVIERYKQFNGLEANSSSTAQTPDGTAVATNVPDNEDINEDNALNATDAYFSVEVPISRDLLESGRSRYVADRQVYLDQATNDQVKWYLMRIPIRGSQVKAVNGPSYKTVRFFRMYFKEFRSPVVLRLADFQLVGSQWRVMDPTTNYEDLVEGPKEDEKARYDALIQTVVSREENERSTFMPYRTPPEVKVDSDPSTLQNRRLNEQALQMSVVNLKDGKSAMLFKNLNLDLVNYGRLRMPIHAHQYSVETPLRDRELVAVFRIGTDVDQNFYQVEIPLYLTPLNPGQGISAEGIWLAENELDISLAELYAVKGERDRLQKPIGELYGSLKGKNFVSIVGRPNLAEARVIAIGVRNPSQKTPISILPILMTAIPSRSAFGLMSCVPQILTKTRAGQAMHACKPN
ncbi:MAG: cell surface protein SprA [Cytophagales bacterium]|nr:cell surface protein SprA [Cytophagales bacterium]